MVLATACALTLAVVFAVQALGIAFMQGWVRLEFDLSGDRHKLTTLISSDLHLVSIETEALHAWPARSELFIWHAAD